MEQLKLFGQEFHSLPDQQHETPLSREDGRLYSGS